MRRKLRIAVISIVVLLVLLLLAVLGLYLAAQHEPEFYRQAMQAEPEVLRQGSDRMLQRVTVLKNDVRRVGQWQTIITAEEINGWLAVDLVENHPNALPDWASDPRVAIDPEHVLMACRVQRGKVKGIVTFDVDVAIAETNMVALRIRTAQAGLLPLPLEKIAERVTTAAQRMELRIEWRQVDGDRVAMISVPPPKTDDDKAVRIETLELREGEIYLDGTTGPVEKK
ncbi:MAG: hypothetical protein HQ581_07900 [Planctomycetes bacterium]|nr:hypothetical protein [Planctomycetota bacterium]